MSGRKQLVRTIPFWRFVRRDGSLITGARLGHRGFTDLRYLSGPVGQGIQRFFEEGQVRFLDKTPKNLSGKLMVIGVAGGLVVAFHQARYTPPIIEMINICDRYRDKIVGGLGQVRWAALKAVTA